MAKKLRIMEQGADVHDQLHDEEQTDLHKKHSDADAYVKSGSVPNAPVLSPSKNETAEEPKASKGLFGFFKKQAKTVEKVIVDAVEKDKAEKKSADKSQTNTSGQGSHSDGHSSAVHARQDDRKAGRGLASKPISQGYMNVQQLAEQAAAATTDGSNSVHAAEEEAMSMLRREALLMKASQGPGVVKFLGANLRQDAKYLVLEWMSRKDLQNELIMSLTDEQSIFHAAHPFNRALKERGVADPVFFQIVRAAREIATGISHIHAADIVHRDLAARNVLLDSRFHCKVGDFGLAAKLTDLQQQFAADAEIERELAEKAAEMGDALPPEELELLRREKQRKRREKLQLKGGKAGGSSLLTEADEITELPIRWMSSRCWRNQRVCFWDKGQSMLMSLSACTRCLGANLWYLLFCSLLFSSSSYGFVFVRLYSAGACDKASASSFPVAGGSSNALA